MPKVFRTTILLVAMLILCVALITPPSEKLSLGKDLRGGVTLVYTVDMSQTEESPRQVLTDMIDVIRERINPNGTLDISLVSSGRDRIEITMPLPREEVKALRRTFEQELAKLGAFSVNQNTLLAALARPAKERDAALARLAAGDEGRLNKLKLAAAAFDADRDARKAYEAAALINDPAISKDDLIIEASKAKQKLEQALADVLAEVLQPDRLRAILLLPDAESRLRDAQTGTQVTFPSPRQSALDAIKQQHPTRAAEIDSAVAAYNAYVSQRKGLDDPQDLIRMLRGSGVLSFRITVKPGQERDENRLRQELRERGPGNVRAGDTRWYRINKIENWYNTVQQAESLRANPREFFSNMGYVVEEYLGKYYMLAWDVPGSRLTQADGTWKVASAGEGRDEIGRPSITFRMDTAGAFLLGNLTKNHVGNQMAVLLDDEVYTAPTLQSAISSNGQITGEFSPAERAYVIKVLAAGSLQAKLSPDPISISSQTPSLGADNLDKGMWAGIYALIGISAFMVVYYFTSGVIAILALISNGLIILALMAMNHAAFTLPGIAGVILTFGMAVDCNVLIFERIREELRRGNDLKTSVRLGFSKAFSSIVDGNITNLIVCVVLGLVGTPEIRGFAITMGIGVLSTLLCGLVVSRNVFDLLLFTGWRRTSMLPLAIPALQAALTPKINWLRLRGVFFVVSAAYVSLGLVMAFGRGEKMLDTEFTGGTVVDLVFKRADDNAPPVLMTRAQVEDRVHAIGLEAPADSPLRQLASAEILVIDDTGDGVTSDHFKVKTKATETNLILDAVVGAFRDQLDVQPKLTFTLEGPVERQLPPVRPIVTDDLADAVGIALPVPQNVREFRGGAAVLLLDITPPPSLAQLRDRLERTRFATDYSDTLSRPRDIFVLEGDESAVRSAAVVVFDSAASYEVNPEEWNRRVRDREAQLVLDALGQASTPASVQSFSPAIAATFKAQAVASIVLSFLLIAIYIWVRFQSFRYAIAALVATTHDVLVVLGLVAFAELMFEWGGSWERAAVTLNMLPFKIDLNMIAAMLTVAGYSLNDTVVIMDRVREVRGKSVEASAAMINDSINQTISRTMITAGTTAASSLALYIWGGEGVRAFAFALTVGVLVGTYSTIAIAAPIVWVRSKSDRTPAR